VKEEDKRQVCGVCPAIGSTMAARRRRRRLFLKIKSCVTSRAVITASRTNNDIQLVSVGELLQPSFHHGMLNGKPPSSKQIDHHLPIKSISVLQTRFHFGDGHGLRFPRVVRPLSFARVHICCIPQINKQNYKSTSFIGNHLQI
jgi:hypothetical protein